MRDLEYKAAPSFFMHRVGLCIEAFGLSVKSVIVFLKYRNSPANYMEVKLPKGESVVFWGQ